MDQSLGGDAFESSLQAPSPKTFLGIISPTQGVLWMACSKAPTSRNRTTAAAAIRSLPSHERLFRLADKGTAICILSRKYACKFPTLMCNYSGSSIDWQLRWRNQFKSQRLMPIVHTWTQYAHSTKMYIYIMHIIATAHKGAHVHTYIYICVFVCLHIYSNVDEGYVIR